MVERAIYSCDENIRIKQERVWHNPYPTTRLTPEQKERNRLRCRELREKLILELKERKRKKINEYYRNYLKNLNPEKREELNQKRRERYKNSTTEQKEKRRQRGREYWMKKQTEKKEQKTSKYCKRSLRTSVRFDKGIAVEGSSRDVKHKFFCHKCQKQFLNSDVLIEHVILHVSLPSVVVLRVDEPKRSLHTIKKEGERLEINGDLLQNVVIKTERIDNDEDVNHEQDNTKDKIEFDNVTFYTRIKKEMENTNLHIDSSQNVCIKPDPIEYDKDIYNELNNTKVKIEVDDASLYTHIKQEIENT